MDARRPLCQQVCQSGEELCAGKHYASRDIKQRIKNLNDKWKKLDDLANTRRTKLEDAAESHQVRSEANNLLKLAFCIVLVTQCYIDS